MVCSTNSTWLPSSVQCSKGRRSRVALMSSSMVRPDTAATKSLLCASKHLPTAMRRLSVQALVRAVLPTVIEGQCAAWLLRHRMSRDCTTILPISGAEPWVSDWGAAAPHQQCDDPFGFCVRQAAARDHDMHYRSSGESTVRPELPQHAPALQVSQDLPALSCADSPLELV